MQVELKEAKICIVGLGYVGLPLASAFSNHFRVIGFDNNPKRIAELNLKKAADNLTVTDNPTRIKEETCASV